MPTMLTASQRITQSLCFALVGGGIRVVPIKQQKNVSAKRKELVVPASNCE